MAASLRYFTAILSKVPCHNICVVIQSIYELGIALEFFAKESAATD